MVFVKPTLRNNVHFAMVAVHDEQGLWMLSTVIVWLEENLFWNCIWDGKQ